MTKINRTKSLTGRLGGFALHATHDSNEIAAKARRGFDAKFAREVRQRAEDSGEDLTEAEITRRAAHARKAHFARMALAKHLAAKRRNA